MLFFFRVPGVGGWSERGSREGNSQRARGGGNLKIWKNHRFPVFLVLARGHTEGLNIVLGSLHPRVYPPPRSRGLESLDISGWSDGVPEGV